MSGEHQQGTEVRVEELDTDSIEEWTDDNLINCMRKLGQRVRAFPQASV